MSKQAAQPVNLSLVTGLLGNIGTDNDSTQPNISNSTPQQAYQQQQPPYQPQPNYQQQYVQQPVYQQPSFTQQSVPVPRPTSIQNTQAPVLNPRPAQKVLTTGKQASAPVAKNTTQALVEFYQSTHSKKTNEQTIVKLDEFVNTWLGICTAAETFAILKLYKSLPLLGTEAEIDAQEKANKDLGVAAGFSEESIKRKAAIALYKIACTKGRELDLYTNLQYKPDWTNLGRTPSIKAIADAFGAILKADSSQAKELFYWKIMYQVVDFNTLFGLCMAKMNAAVKILNSIKSYASPVSKGATVNGRKMSEACCDYPNLGPDVDGSYATLISQALIPDFRLFLLSNSMQVDPENIKSAIVATMITLGRGVGDTRLEKFLGSEIRLEKGMAGLSPFVIAWYGMLKCLRNCLRNAVAKLVPQVRRGPIKDYGPIKVSAEDIQ